MVYTKEDVINASLMRFKGKEGILRPMYEKFYDENGKIKFRTYASVTPQVMREYYEKH